LRPAEIRFCPATSFAATSAYDGDVQIIGRTSVQTAIAPPSQSKMNIAAATRLSGRSALRVARCRNFRIKGTGIKHFASQMPAGTISKSSR
jgi:hypothetical protein